MKKQLFGFLFLILFSMIISAQTQEAQKIDEINNNDTCESYLAKMDAINNAALSDLTSKIYVFVYEGKEKAFSNKSGKFELFLPRFGQAKAKINSIIKLSSFHKRSTDNMVFINGGFRENLSVEFWIVPLGVEPPKPTPTLKKMKYRKGKPIGFCLGCC